MFAYLITEKENRKKERGATRTNDLCIFSFPLACGLGGKKVDEQIEYAAAATSHSSFQIVFLIITCSSTFFNGQRIEENIHSSKKKRLP
jgi:hypothetical protein